MVPSNLDGWTLESLRLLLDRKYREAESFDYKVWKEGSKTPKEKDDIRTDCCAFANSQGGFLIYGVDDDIDLSTDARLRGVDAAIDFPLQFTPFPSCCTPSISWVPKNPPIEIAHGKVIQVIQIPRSWRGPHSPDGVADALKFPKRTSGGNAYMRHDEVRNAFLGFYEKRLKLDLLLAELHGMFPRANAAKNLSDAQLDHITAFPPFNLGLIESVVTETYALLSEKPSLLEALMQIRRHCEAVNDRIMVFYNIQCMPLTNEAEIRRRHNSILREICGHLVPAIQRALTSLQDLRA